MSDTWVEIEVPPEIYREMGAWAVVEGVSVDHLADRVLREYLDKRKSRRLDGPAKPDPKPVKKPKKGKGK